MGFSALWKTHGGGICPVLKTDAMTNPVGVDRNGRLWAAGDGGGTIVSGAGVTTLTGTIGGYSGPFSITPADLPEGAVIDKIDIYETVTVATTFPAKITIYPMEDGTAYSYADDGSNKFTRWSYDLLDDLYVFHVEENSLYSSNLSQSTATITGGKIYYHIE